MTDRLNRSIASPNRCFVIFDRFDYFDFDVAPPPPLICLPSKIDTQVRTPTPLGSPLRRVPRADRAAHRGRCAAARRGSITLK
jgi:hypothetical protein